MSIIYPLALPPGNAIAKVRLTARSIVGLSQSPFTGAQQVQAFPGQWFEAELALKPLGRAEAELWNAWRLKLNGRQGTFLLGDPAGTRPRGTLAGTPLMNGATPPAPRRSRSRGSLPAPRCWIANFAAAISPRHSVYDNSSISQR